MTPEMHMRAKNAGLLSPQNSQWTREIYGPTVSPTPDGYSRNPGTTRQPWRQEVASAARGSEVMYYPERTEEIVKELDVKGINVKIISGDIRYASGSLCLALWGGASEAVMAAAGQSAEEEREHNRRLYGEIPMSCVGCISPHSLPSATSIFHVSYPAYQNGHFHETRWLESTYHNLFEEAVFNSSASLSIHGVPPTWSAALSAPILKKAISLWGQCEGKHTTSASVMNIYLDTREQAAELAALF
eukprot:TRINITY_DN1940_c1_g1_i3.p1 TRINITY_DN1940_c1_g1~~TRINITY_DN1940_c1_g1_i3.p1  ORF type:complete len:245 (+),score=21.75 TRINITY_DN1940_c1_g1_i3:272-1006(+)